MKEVTVKENVWDYVPTNSNGEEDWAMSRDGGNYAFGHKDVVLNGKTIGQLETTSASFDFCQLCGRFTETIVVEVKGTDISFEIERESYKGKVCNPYEITVDEFVSYFHNDEKE